MKTDRQRQIEKVEATCGIALHPHLLIGDTVKVKPLQGVIGKITGIALQHVVCSYIVTVSEKDAIVIPGYETKSTSFVVPESELELIE